MKRSDALVIVSSGPDEHPPQPQSARPATRGDCARYRSGWPCELISCRYHLVGAEEGHRGAITIGDHVVPQNPTEHDLDEAADALVEQLAVRGSCSLDIADREADGATLEEVGRRMNVTRERIRQIESKGLRKLVRGVRAARIGISAADLRTSATRIERSDDAQPYPQRAPTRSPKQPRTDKP